MHICTYTTDIQLQEEAEEVLASSRSSAPLMEPPQVMYPTYGQVTYMQQVPQGVQMLQPMSYAVSQGGEYTVTEPVTAMASYVYDQSVPMAYQPVAAQWAQISRFQHEFGEPEMIQWNPAQINGLFKCPSSTLRGSSNCSGK